MTGRKEHEGLWKGVSVGGTSRRGDQGRKVGKKFILSVERHSSVVSVQEAASSY